MLARGDIYSLEASFASASNTCIFRFTCNANLQSLKQSDFYVTQFLPKEKSPSNELTIVDRSFSPQDFKYIFKLRPQI